MADVSSKTIDQGTRFTRCRLCRLAVGKDPESLRSHMGDHALAQKKCPHCHVQLSPGNPDSGKDFYFVHLSVCSRLPRGFASEEKNLTDTKTNDTFQKTSSSKSSIEDPRNKSASELLSKLSQNKAQFPKPGKRTVSESDKHLTVSAQYVKTSGSIPATTETENSCMGNSGGDTTKKMKLTNCNNAVKVNCSQDQNATRTNCGNLSIRSLQIYEIPTTAASLKTPLSATKSVTSKSKFGQDNANAQNERLSNGILSLCDDLFSSRKVFHERKSEVQKKHCKKCNIVFTSKSNIVLCPKCRNCYGKSISSQGCEPALLQKCKKSLKLFNTSNNKNVSNDVNRFKTASLDDDDVNFPKDRSGVVKKETKFKCIKCGRSFKEFTGVSKHVNSCKFNNNCEAVNDEDIIWVCSTCSSGFKSDMEFESHKESCSRLPKKKPKKPDKCFIKSGKNNVLNKVADPKIRKFWCRFCGFYGKRNFGTHSCEINLKYMQSCKVVLENLLRHGNEQICVSDVATSETGSSRMGNSGKDIPKKKMKLKNSKNAMKVNYRKKQNMSFRKTSHLKKCGTATKNNEVICLSEIPNARTNLSGDVIELNSSEHVGCEQGHENSENSGKLSRGLKCKSCGGKFLSKEGFERHVVKRHSSKTSFCSDCKTSFDHLLSFQLHRCNPVLSSPQENTENSDDPPATSNIETSSSDQQEVPDDNGESGDIKPDLESFSTCEENSEITVYEQICTKQETENTPSDDVLETGHSQNSDGPSSASNVEISSPSESSDIKPDFESLLPFRQSTSEETEDTSPGDTLERDGSQNPSQTALGSPNFGNASASISNASCVERSALSAQNSRIRPATNQRSSGCHQKFPSQASRREQVSSGCANRTTGVRNAQIPNSHQQSNYVQCSHNRDIFSGSNPPGVNNFDIFQPCEVINMTPHMSMYQYFAPNTSGCIDPQQPLKNIFSSFSTRNTPQRERNCTYRNGYRHPRALYFPSNQAHFSRLNSQRSYETTLPVRNSTFHFNDPFHQFCATPASAPVERVPRNRLTAEEFHEGRNLDSNTSCSSLVSESSESSNSVTSTATPIISRCWSERTSSKRPNEPVIPLQEVEVIFIKDDMHSYAYAVVNKTSGSKSVERFICKNCRRSFSKGDLIGHLKEKYNLKIERELKVTEL